MAWTFSMVCVAWVFFRAESVGEAVGYLGRIFSNLELRYGFGVDSLIELLFVIVLLIFSEVFILKKKLHPILKYAYWTFISLVIIHFYGDEQQFIYFEF